MRRIQLDFLLGVGILSLCCTAGWSARAGGCGLNTVVVINQSSSNSCELGNYFCERRQVPPDNVLHISWPGTNTHWTSNEFQVNLLTPLRNMLAARQLTNQVCYVVLSMDIPFQTGSGSAVNGSTSALFYGLKPDALGTKGVVNSYAASEQIFAQAKPWTAPGYSFLATMITADSLAQAKQLVDQGVASDGTFPAQPVILAKSSDPVRNIRYSAFDDAIFNAQVRGWSSVVRTNSDSPWGQTNLLGYETGLANFSVSPGAFVPGAMADSLSSFGGVIFGPNGQTSLLAFINAGAAGSYGTVTEPIQDPSKFPDPQVYFYQSRGFSLAECYYQGLKVPYLGLVVGEPLAAPFAQPGSGGWLSTNTILSGLAPLSVRFSAPDALTLRQIDLFVDGHYFQTLTNLTPRAGNVLNLALNGYPIAYTVPTNANLGLVAMEFAAVLNTPAVTNVTKLVAYPHGDRIELQSLSTNQWAEPLYFNDTSGNSSNCWYRANYLPDTSPPLLTPVGLDRSGAFRLHVDIASTYPYVIECSTNLYEWVSVFTNLAGGLLDFADAGAAAYSSRFYRVAESVPDPQPSLAATDIRNGGLRLHIETAAALPYAIQVSTNFGDWTPLFTNQLGGAMDFVDVVTPTAAPRFYRTWNIPPAPPSVTTSDGPAGNALVRVDNATRPFVLEVSTNLNHWAALVTNYALGEVQTVTCSSVGSADALTTFLTASRKTFLNTTACGLRKYTIEGPVAMGDWLQLDVTETNGATTTLVVSNQSTSPTAYALAGQLISQINSAAELQGTGGIVGEDLVTNVSGVVFFNLKARSPGCHAAGTLVQLTGPGSLRISPTGPQDLKDNVSDLRPRNHLYVTAGVSRLGVDFTLDTSTLADGYHELTAVAYEGSHVGTQTKATLPVMIKNTSLGANLTLLDLPDTAPVQGSYHIQVTTITTNEIATIALCSTGGVLDTVTNQAVAAFQVVGTRLGVGQHAFYALVRDTGGLSYRTDTKWVRFTGGQ